MWSFLEKGSIIIAPCKKTNCFRLADIVKFSQGFKTGADKVFVVYLVREEGGLLRVHSTATGTEHQLESDILRPLIKSEHMRRFEIRPTSLRLLFPYKVTSETWRIFEQKELGERYPNAWEYLQLARPFLDKRESGRFAGEHFYQYSRQQNFIPLSKAKLITPDMADQMRFSFDGKGEFVFSDGAAGGVCVIPQQGIDPLLLMGILNSTLIEHQIRQKNGQGFRGGYLNCEIRFLRDVPIQLPKSSSQKKTAGEIVERVKRVLAKKNELQAPLIGDRDREQLEREIETHEAQINELVRQLYRVDKTSDHLPSDNLAKLTGNRRKT